MPELPEVETVRRGLSDVLEGQVLRAVTVRRRDLRLPVPDGFETALTGRRVIELGRRAKYLLVYLDDGQVLIGHLGMSGRMIIWRPGRDGPPLPPGRHDHIVFTAADGTRVTYCDPRRFGLMVLTREDGLEHHRLFARLGPEPLSNRFNGVLLGAALAGRRSSLKAALLDQRVVAGLGNIYVCEALFRARLSPRRQAGAVGPRRADRLSLAIRAVLEEAIEAGGSSLKDYARPDGELGYFQHRFQVYGRAGESCLTPGCRGIIRRLVQAGRSSFYCPVCQK